MNQLGRTGSLRGLFRRRSCCRDLRRRERNQQPSGRLEPLEQRRLLAIDFVSASVVDGDPFFTTQANQSAIPLAGTLFESPQQVILRFTPGSEIDPLSLGGSLGGISIVRSGSRDDGFGTTGTLPDIAVRPGVLVVDDLPGRNQVVIRFAETLPDDTYRFTISSTVDPGSGEITGLRTVDGQAFRGGDSFSFDVRVSLGPQVVAVVPQPINRDPDDLTADLTQARDTIEVFFNAAEPLNPESAENVEFYKLIEIDDATGEDIDGTTVHPLRVMYDVSAHKAKLEFATDEIADAKLYRLEIGGSGILVDPQVIPGIVGDAGSSFDTSLAAGVIDEAGVTVSASIDPEGSVAMPGTLPDLLYPTQPGTIDEPGHRDIPIDFSNHGFDELGYETVTPAGTEIFTVPFNFQTHYGDDAQGNPLSNLITAEQKLRVREVFDLFSRYAGVRFVETAAEGITVALGDTRVISDNSPITSLEGLSRGSVNNGVPSTDALAIVNSNRDWGESEYGGDFFLTAMRQIGKVLGLWNSYDVPSVLGESLPGENVFPSDYDLIHLQQLYPRGGTDIDLYTFSLAEAGTLSAETIAGRLPAGASTLDSVLSVFSETYEATARVIGAVTTVVGESAVVQGTTTTVAGASTTITAVGATVAGVERTYTGKDLTVEGAETTVVGQADTVVGVAAEVTGVEASVLAVAAQATGTRATITALAAQVAEAVSDTTTVVLDDVSGISVGAAVSASGSSGIPVGTTVVLIDSLDNSVVLSASVTLAADTFLEFSISNTKAVASRRFVVSDATAAAVGAPVNQVIQTGGRNAFTNSPDFVPRGTMVAGVDLSSRVVSFSTPITVAKDDELGFGSTTAQLALDDVSAIPVGAKLGLPPAGGNLGNQDTRPSVVSVNSSLGVVTLSAPFTATAGEILAFDQEPIPGSFPVRSQRFFIDSADGAIVEGLFVSGPQGIPGGTTVGAIEQLDRNENGIDDELLVTFSEPVTLAARENVGFGFFGKTIKIKVEDASAVLAGSTIEGLGVPLDTRVSSIDRSTPGEVRLNLSKVVNVPDGVNLGFSLPETGTVNAKRLVVSQGGRGITAGAPLSDAAGNDLGVSVARVDGRVVTLDGPLSVGAADEIFFGVAGRTIYVANTAGISVGRPVTASGVASDVVVNSVDQATGRVMLSGDVNLTHAAAVAFGFVGTQVTVEDATGVDVGAPVTAVAGVDAGITVTKVDGNTLTLSDRVTVADGSTLTVGTVGTVVEVDDLTGVQDPAGVPGGVKVTVQGVADQTRYVAFLPKDQSDLTQGGTITLDTSVTIAPGATLGFGSNVNTVELDTDSYNGELAGATISVNGTPSGITVSAISGTTATLSGPLDVADGDRLAFSFTGPLDNTDQIIVADASQVTVGAELAGSQGVKVTEVDQTSGLVRLSNNVSVTSGSAVTFGYGGNEIVLADAGAAVVGVPLSGAGIPADTLVIGKIGNRLTLSQSVTVAHEADVEIGFYSDKIQLDDATGVEEDVLINGAEGIRPGTSVLSVNGNEITLTHPVRVAGGQTVGFGFAGSTGPFGIGSAVIQVDDLTGIDVGATVSGLPSDADGTITVTAISPTDPNVPPDLTQGGTVTLSSNVSVPDGLELRFGGKGTTTLTIDDTTGVSVGDTVSGLGIPANVTVTATDPSTNEITLSQSVTVSADAILGFGTPTRELIARNDNAFGRDSFLKLDLEAGNYFVAVTSVGNTDFDPAIEQSGGGGRTEGAYDLSLKFKPAASAATTVVDASGTPLDGDRDGQDGGTFNFWFRTAAETDTIYVNKLSFNAAAVVTEAAVKTTTVKVDDSSKFETGMEIVGLGVKAGTTVKEVVDGTTLELSGEATIDAGRAIYAAGDLTPLDPYGSLANPYRTISEAINAAVNDPSKTIIRVVGNTGTELSNIRISGTNRSLRPNALAAEIDPHHYYVGLDESGNSLTDGDSLILPAGVTLMVDAGTVLRMRQANIDVGSSSELASRSGAALQILGIPENPVRITSAVQGATATEEVAGPVPEGGDWGGIVLRADSDWQPSGNLSLDTLRPFLNTINHAVIEYAGGEVVVDSEQLAFSAIQIEGARPSLGFSQILRSASNAIAATPNSFVEAGGRAGPQLSGNTLRFNSTNGLFVAIRTEYGVPLDTLDVAARFSSTQVTYVLQENLVLTGGQGSYYKDGSGTIRARSSGRLAIDPGVVVKLQNARIEMERGSAQLIAEGHPTKQVVFTNLGDNRFGAGGTFDTNGNQPDGYGPGRWGGIILNAGSQASIDNAFISSAGGEVPIEGRLDQFNVIEVHQGDLRLANSRLQDNADGLALTDRTARGSNEAATIFVRGAQPVIVNNDFRDNVGALISVNANSMIAEFISDPGRQTSFIAKAEAYAGNQGPLFAGNSISYSPVVGSDKVAGLVIRSEEIVVDSVWDDTDIVHVLQDEIIVNNLHTATSLKLLSQQDASLVVKLAGANAGLTASGELLDIDDRVGGTVQVIGQPGFPVVLTSLSDDTVGASLDAYGFPVTDTNVDGAVSQPGPGDWRSLQFLPLSNDRNVASVSEVEPSFNASNVDANSAVGSAEFLGTLAPNYASDGNTWESAQEKSGDENRRLGFVVSGTISTNRPTDIDVYSFDGYAGSEVWVDIDQTSYSLDTMVEILDADGRVLARSADSQTDTGVVREAEIDQSVGGVTGVVGDEILIQGETANVKGIAAEVIGVAAALEGTETTLTHAATKVVGVASRVVGDAATVDQIVKTVVGRFAFVRGVAVQVEGDVVNQLTVDVNNDDLVQRNAGVTDANNVFIGTVQSTSQGNNPTDADPNDESITLDTPVTANDGDLLRVGYNGNTIFLDNTNNRLQGFQAQIQPGAAVTGLGIPANTTVVSVNESTGELVLSQSVNVLHNVTLTFSYVNSSQIRLDNVTDLSSGDDVFINGIDTGADISSINASTNEIDLTGPVSLVDGDVVAFTFVGNAPQGRFVVNGAVGPAAGDRVTYSTGTTATVVSAAPFGASWIVEADQPISVASGDTVHFGDTVEQGGTTISLDEADAIGFGSEVLVDGVRRGTVSNKSGSDVTITADAQAGFSLERNDLLVFTTIDPTGNSSRVVVDDVAGIANGSVLDAINGVAPAVSVSISGTPDLTSDPAINIIQLDSPVAVSDQNTLAITTSGSSQRTQFIVGNTVNVEEGAPVSLDVLGAGSTDGEPLRDIFGDEVVVTEVIAGPINYVRLSAPVDLGASDLLRFGRVVVNGSSFAVDDLTDIVPGSSFWVDGINVGSISGTSPGQVTVALTDPSQILPVADGELLGFGVTGAVDPAINRFLVDEATGVVIGDTLSEVGTTVHVDPDPVVMRVSSSQGDAGMIEFNAAPTLAVAANTLFTLSSTSGIFQALGIAVDDASSVLDGVPISVNGATQYDSSGSLIVVQAGGVRSSQGDSVRLSAPITTQADDEIGFGFNGTTVTIDQLPNNVTTRLIADLAAQKLVQIVVQDSDGNLIDLDGVTRLADDDFANNEVILDRPIAVPDGATLIFGFKGTWFTANNAADLVEGATLYGDNVWPGTTITAINPATGRVDVSRPIDLPSDQEPIDLFPGQQLTLSRTFDLISGSPSEAVSLLPGSVSGVIYEETRAIQTFTVSRSGEVAFASIGTPARVYNAGFVDHEIGIMRLDWDPDLSQPNVSRVDVDFEYGTLGLDTLGFTEEGEHGRYSLERDSEQGGDYGTTNPRDAGMRLTLPGVEGEKQKYFIRVRSQPAVGENEVEYEENLTKVPLVAGKTEGHYSLSLRLRQRDEAPGSVVRFADIRYPVTGVDVVGLPNNSPLVGTSGENPNGNNDSFQTAQPLGNLLTSDRNTISVAGEISAATDVDWYSFSLTYEQIQNLAGHNDGLKSFATIFDIDYADGFRGDLTLSIFDENGRLIYVGRDSDIEDDQPGVGQEGGDIDDLSRGSVGVLDPFIGAIQLPAGNPNVPVTYYVAVSSNAYLPAELNATFETSANNELVRMEPVNSVVRLVEDHIGTNGYATWGPSGDPYGNRQIEPLNGSIINTSSSLELAAHVRPFTLADVTLFVSTGSGVVTVDAYTGGQETTIGGASGLGDIDMRGDGQLFVYRGLSGDASNVGELAAMDTGDGSLYDVSRDGIVNRSATTPLSWQTNSDSVLGVAFDRTGVATYGDLWLVVNDNGSSKLFEAASGGSATAAADATASQVAPTASGRVPGYRGHIQISGSDVLVTGIQHRNESGNLYGITQDGRFIQIDPPARAAAPDSGARQNFNATQLADFSSVLSQVGGTFQGLATAPVNLEGGRYAGMFFAVTSTGRLICIDPDGLGTGQPAILANVFDNDRDGIADSDVSNVTVSGATGLAFSPLDINLWHPTRRRGDLPSDPAGGLDVGHGIEPAPDFSRPLPAADDFGNGAVSMYFGLEEYDTSSPAYTGWTPGNYQYGAQQASWQQDLTARATVGDNYNLPGGSYGSLETGSFSLAGYNASDLPTLYFNYFLETEDASAPWLGTGMRDSARVFISVNQGQSWSLLATNNQSRSGLDNFGATTELPNTLSASPGVGEQWNQRVQELFDTGTWRQARVDLSEFAGSSSVQLRFDFSTAGEFDSSDDSLHTPEIIRAYAGLPADLVPGAITTNRILLDSADGLREGMLVHRAADTYRDGAQGQNSWEVRTVDGFVVLPDGRAEITLSSPLSIDPVSGSVELTVGEALEFFPASGTDKNNISGPARSNGNFFSSERGQDNEYEGFYVDDIIIGFAERGEMITGARPQQTGFYSVATPLGSIDYPKQDLVGAYQLEIRGGTSYADQNRQTTDSGRIVSNNISIVQSELIDTNARLVSEPTLRTIVLAEPVPSVPVQLGGSAGAATSLNAYQWPADLGGLTEGFLEFDFNVGGNETITKLPNSFRIDAQNGAPAGDGVAISGDGGTTWTTVFQFGATRSQWTRGVGVDLGRYAGLLTPNSVIGFFHADTRGSAGGEGINIDNIRVTLGRAVENTGDVGDSNNVHEFEQGQFIIQSNVITSAQGYGVRIDADRNSTADPFGNYPGVTNEPDLGVPRNLPVQNNPGLASGVTVINNVVAGSGSAGILFSGVSSSANEPTSVVPFGRLINNTIFGVVGGNPQAVGIEVTENAGPTILNNVFAELGTGILVDTSSRLDAQGRQRTVINSSSFWNVDAEVVGADQRLAETLEQDPFINSAEGNFYPTVGSGIVDASLSSLQDRNEYRVVTEAIGIAASPIVAPIRDIYGQLRVDDPLEANDPGLGGTVFQDRGAVERSDQVRPFGRLVMPFDQGDSPQDYDDSLDSVVIEGPEARGIRTIAIQLNDVGVGIDKSTVTSDAFVVTRDGTLLLDTIDYQWVYNENTDQVLFRAISVFPLGDYSIDVLTTAPDSVQGVAAKVTDRANNPLRVNAEGGRTTFFVALADVPGLVNGLQGTAGDEEFTIAWNPPLASLAKPVLDYTVQWLEQPTDGEPDWTSPEVESDTVPAGTLSYTVGKPNGDPLVGDPLVNDTPYIFRVAARNGVGLGAFQIGSTAIVPRDRAEAPDSLNGTPVVDQTTKLSQIRLTWTNLSGADLGGHQLVDYRVQYRLSSETDETEWTVQSESSWTVQQNGDVLAVVDGNGAGLTPGREYDFQVAAITEVAESGEQVFGNYSEPLVNVMAAGLPAAPTGLTSSPNADGTLGVSWAAPNDGGSAITGYVVQISLSDPATSQDSWEDYAEIDPPAPTATLDKATEAGARLVPGKKVWVRVKAVNVLDTEGGEFSAASSRFTMPNVPSGTLTVTELTPADKSVTIKWEYEPAAGSSEAPVTKYLVSKRSDSETVFVPEGEIDASDPLEFEFSPAKDNPLVNGTAYEFRIVAVNALSPEVVDVNAVGLRGFRDTAAVTPRRNPDAPTNLVLKEPGDRRLTLEWVAPEDNGGTLIVDYEIEYREYPQSPETDETDEDEGWIPFNDRTSTAITATVTGLENGKEYEVRVRAKTALEGAWTQAGPFTPLGLSAPPTAVVATVPVGVDGTVNLGWNGPTDNGGSGVTGYKVEMSTDGGASWKGVSAIVNVNTTENTATATVGSLTGGIGYNFRVAAETTAGTGVFSVRSNLVVPTQAAPAPVLNSTATVSTSSSIEVAWSDPESGYGANVADYQVEWVELDENDVALAETIQRSFTGSARRFLATSLSAETKYQFKVRARLVTGTYGQWSQSIVYQTTSATPAG